jgi:hypothetical protein
MSNRGQVVLGCLALACGGAAAAQAAGPVQLFADGFESGDTCAWRPGPAACPGFGVETPRITIQAGEAASWCYYFHAPNLATVGIRRWESAMDDVVHHVILYTTPTDRQPPGTISQADCGFDGGGGAPAHWTYAAYDSPSALALPSDDGTGVPLAMEIPAGQPAFLYIYLTNPGPAAVTTSVRLEAEALGTGVSYTRTATYHTYNASLSIPPASAPTFTQTCDTPAAVKFWRISTHTHGLATQARILDGLSPLVVSSDWEHPSVALYGPPAFYEFASGGLTYECSYFNPGNQTVVDGDSELTDENCIGVGYFFPATAPLLCIDEIGPF